MIHIGIRNTETTIEDCIKINLPALPRIGETVVKSPEVSMELAKNIHKDYETYFGVIYPKEKKFKEKIWTPGQIAQAIASFNRVSEVIHWGENIYILMVRHDTDEDLDKLFSTAYNWTE